VSDVFISYKREDRARVETLHALLVDLDVAAWFDSAIEVGADWDHRIHEQIDAARAMIVCWSFAACSSHWVVKEAGIGLERNVLIPVKIHPCALIPPFDAQQTADLTQWEGEPDHPEIQKVLVKLGQLLGKKSLAINARSRAGGQNEELVNLLRAILIERAVSGAPPLTYKEAEDTLREAAAAEDLHVADLNQHTLWGALDSISEQNRRRREPPLNVLVVSKETGRPGRGYWQKNTFLEGDSDELERQVFERHLARVRASSWSQDV
jgi:hypothetical protein